MGSFDTLAVTPHTFGGGLLVDNTALTTNALFNLGSPRTNSFDSAPKDTPERSTSALQGTKRYLSSISAQVDRTNHFQHPNPSSNIETHHPCAFAQWDGTVTPPLYSTPSTYHSSNTPCCRRRTLDQRWRPETCTHRDQLVRRPSDHFSDRYARRL
jgi:hypothetical protein